MKRYTITELVSMRVLGFLREKDNPEYFALMQPLERITQRVYQIENENRVIVESEHYSSTFCIDQYEQLMRLFKDTDVYLAQSSSEEAKELDLHLLVFVFGRGYFAILTPIAKKKEIDD